MKIRFHANETTEGWIAEAKIVNGRKKIFIFAEGDSFEELKRDIKRALRTYFGNRKIQVELIVNLNK